MMLSFNIPIAEENAEGNIEVYIDLVEYDEDSPYAGQIKGIGCLCLYDSY